MRLIDAEALQKEDFTDFFIDVRDAKVFEDIIDHAPTIEAKPVVHAHWEGGIVTFLHCSNCGEKALGTCFEEEFMSNYCPNCGALMDEFASKINVGSKVEEN